MTPAGALEGSALGLAMRQWLYLYPAVETIHIIGIALLFGSIAVLDLRLLGLATQSLKQCLGPIAPQPLLDEANATHS